LGEGKGEDIAIDLLGHKRRPVSAKRALKLSDFATLFAVIFGSAGVSLEGTRGKKRTDLKKAWPHSNVTVGSIT